MSRAESLRRAAGRLEARSYVPSERKAECEALAMLLVNESHAMDGAAERGGHYNSARADLLALVARAILRGES